MKTGKIFPLAGIAAWMAVFALSFASCGGAGKAYPDFSDYVVAPADNGNGGDQSNGNNGNGDNPTGNTGGDNPGTTTEDRLKDMSLSIREIIAKYYAGYNFNFGCTPNVSLLNNPTGANMTRFLTEFSYNTPENSFKQRGVYPNPGAAWGSAEYMNWISVARGNGQMIRCHGPVSPQCSDWAEEDNRTGPELLDCMTYYMTNLAKDLELNKDVVKLMDVVNETVVTSKSNSRKDLSDRVYEVGDWFGPIPGTGGWENPWLTIGLNEDGIPTYITKAFELACQYAPSIKKLYNHNGGMEKAAWDKVKATILYLRSKGYTVDAVGWQGHMSSTWYKTASNLTSLSNLIDWCYANNLEFHVTELDIKWTTNTIQTDQAAKAQEAAACLGAIIETVVKKVGHGACGINMWTLTSRTTAANDFTGMFYPALTDDAPAYVAIKKILLLDAPN